MHPPRCGIATVFLNLSKALDIERPVWALQAKGLEDGEIPHANIAEMADSYLSAIRKVQARGPYHLLGWSQGGIIAHEIAVRLEECGEQVALLALLDTTPNETHALNAESGTDLNEFLRQQLIAFSGMAPDAIPDSYDQRLRRLFDDLVRHEFAPATTTIDWVERLLRQMMIAPSQTHQHVTRVSRVPVILFRASLDSEQSGANSQAWAPYTLGGVKEIMIQSRHMTMCQEYPASEIASHLSFCLFEQP